MVEVNVGMTASQAVSPYSIGCSPSNRGSPCAALNIVLFSFSGTVAAPSATSHDISLKRNYVSLSGAAPTRHCPPSDHGYSGQKPETLTNPKQKEFKFGMYENAGHQRYMKLGSCHVLAEYYLES